MKRFVATLVTLGLAAASALAGTVTAYKVPGDISQIGVTSKAWKSARFTDVMLYPQLTVASVDKEAADAMAAAKPVQAKVKALHDGKYIALLIKWPDGTKSVQGDYSSDTYSDGFAVQFPVNYGDADKLPYIGMGSDDRPVVIHLQKYGVRIFSDPQSKDRGYYKNDNNLNMFGKELAAYQQKQDAKISKDYQKMFVAEGFRSTTEVKDASFRSGMTYYKKNWYGTLVRPLKDGYVNLDSAVVPVAFAAWDGGTSGRDGQKVLSSWIPVKLSDVKGETTLADQLNAESSGDPAKGKELAVANCAACHVFDDQAMAMPYMAPNLASVGGQATVAYLKESMLDPSAVVVPGYNRNAHPNFAWYNVVEGKRVSTMPDFTWMQPQEIEDLAAYFMTLK